VDREFVRKAALGFIAQKRLALRIEQAFIKNRQRR
jgi:hypothetical protein